MFLNLSQLQFSLIIFDFYDLFLQKIRKCQNENIWLFFSFGRTLKLFSTFAFRPKQSKSLTELPQGEGGGGSIRTVDFFVPSPYTTALLQVWVDCRFAVFRDAWKPFVNFAFSSLSSVHYGE